MSYIASGDVSMTAIAKAYGSPYSKMADVQDFRLSGYDLGYSNSGKPRNLPKLTVRRQTQLTTKPDSYSVKPYAIGRLLNKAERLARDMELYSQNSELIDLSNSGFSLTHTLDDLWALRSEREADWGDLLNLLQGAIAKEEFERFSAQQCAAIRKTITDHLAGGYVEIDDIERSIRLLRDAGLDPWKGISGAIGG